MKRLNLDSRQNHRGAPAVEPAAALYGQRPDDRRSKRSVTVQRSKECNSDSYREEERNKRRETGINDGTLEADRHVGGETASTGSSHRREACRVPSSR